jgi:hypothetical protein
MHVCFLGSVFVEIMDLKTWGEARSLNWPQRVFAAQKNLRWILKWQGGTYHSQFSSCSWSPIKYKRFYSLKNRIRVNMLNYLSVTEACVVGEVVNFLSFWRCSGRSVDSYSGYCKADSDSLMYILAHSSFLSSTAPFQKTSEPALLWCLRDTPNQKHGWMNGIPMYPLRAVRT